MRRQILAVATLAAILEVAGAHAQADGTLDSAFGASGAVRIPFDLPDSSLFDRPTGVGVDGAGRLVVAGLAESYNGSYLTTSGALARLTPGGALDPSFGSGGRVVWSDDIVGQGDFDGLDLLVLSDGRVVVAGERWLGGAAYQLFVRWYDANGAFAGEYTLPVSEWGADARLTLDPVTGWPLVAYSEDTGQHIFRCFRLRPDLLVDPSYGVDGFLDVAPAVPVLQGIRVGDVVAYPDGRLLVAGTLTVPSVDSWFAALIATDGTGLQGSFGAEGLDQVTVDLGGGPNSQLRSAALDAEGRVLLAGEAFGTGYSDAAAVLVRRTASGGADSSFNGGAPLIVADTAGWDSLFGVVAQSDGRILVAGRVNAPSARFFAARFDAIGAADWSFGSFGVFSANFPSSPEVDFATGLVLQSGRPVLVGPAQWSLTDYDFGVLRLTGSLLFAAGFEDGSTAGWSAVVP